MRKLSFVLLLAMLCGVVQAQITDYSIFKQKFNFYVANDL